jgi:uncharacterized protein
MERNEVIDKLKEIKPILEKEYFVTEIGVFGSYVRGEQTSNSDVDILIDHSRGLTFFKLIDLENFISSVLNTKVDIAFKKYLKPQIGKKILSEVIYV